MSQDVIPAEAIQVTYALIDEITSEIILNIDHRLQKFEALQYFLNSLPEPSRKTKELHVQVAAILTAVTAWDPYDTTFEDSKQSATADDESLLEKAPPLVYWSAGQWDELSARIYTLMEALDVGYDATLESVFSSIILHEKPSKIRRQLEEQLAKKSSGQVDMHSDLIAQFAEDIMSTEEQGLRNELENLLVGADARATRSKRVPALSLKPIEELKFTMRDAPFAFGYFQRKLEKLMLHWARGSIPSLKSTLEEKCERIRSSLKTRSVDKARKRNQVHDGSEAENSAKKRTVSAKKRPKMAPKNEDNRDEADDEEMLETGGVQILDDEEDEDQKFQNVVVAKKRRKPLKFSREEKNAIREGVEEFGDRSWSLIRDAFPVLRHRTYAKALKGCYNTMLKNGELIKQEIISENDNSTDDEEGSPGKRPKLCFSPSGNKSMFARKLWTATEKAAVYNGVGKHGVGRWKAIKEDDEFAEVLADRTAVQIKDCYRVLKKSGDWVEPQRPASE